MAAMMRSLVTSNQGLNHILLVNTSLHYVFYVTSFSTSYFTDSCDRK